MVNLTSFADRDVGQRDKLEDFVLHGELETAGGLHLHIILVADGAGGGEAGELAARLTGRTIHDHLEISEEVIIPKLLIEAVEEANRTVYNELQGDGTSTVALAVVDLDDQNEYGRLYIAHVGDSHIGLMRDSQFLRLNISHTIANEYYYAGQITADEAERLANGSYPTRVIGVNPEIVVDIGFYIESGTPVVNAERAFNIGRVGMKLQEGDSILVASDGLFTINAEDKLPYVHEDELLRHALDNDVENAVRSIIRYASSRRPVDNISLAMMFLPSRLRRAVVTSGLTGRQRLLFGSIVGILVLAILFLGTFFSRVLNEQLSVAQTQEAVLATFQAQNATATPTLLPTVRPIYRDANQIGWQYFGINSFRDPVVVLPQQVYESPDESFFIVEGKNGDQMPPPPEFHGASVFLVQGSDLNITFVENTPGQEHYEQTLSQPNGELFANNHIFERNSSMVLNLPQRTDMSFHTEVYCVAAKHIPPAENPQSPDQEKERLAFTCFDNGATRDGKCIARMPENFSPDENDEIELNVGERYLFNLTDGELMSSGPTIYEEVKDYYDLVVRLTGTDEEVTCLSTPYLDEDGDGFSYPDDLCEGIQGPADGCPDRDLDGVADILDACPDEYGIPNLEDPNLNGCPPDPEIVAITETANAQVLAMNATSEALLAAQATAEAYATKIIGDLQATQTAFANSTPSTFDETATALVEDQLTLIADINATSTALVANQTDVAGTGTASAGTLAATLTDIANSDVTETAAAIASQTAAALGTGTADAIMTVAGTATDAVPPDTDLDGIPDASDNCPNNYNPNQEDADNDGIGSACDNDEFVPPDTNTIDISVSKSASPSQVGEGDTVQFSITVQNIGGLDATNVTIADNLQDGFTFIDGSITNNGAINGTIISWTIASLPAGNTVNLSFKATVNASGTYTNTARFTGTDNNSANNDSSMSALTLLPDLVVTKDLVSPPQYIHVGDTIEFSITVTNNSPFPSTVTTLSDVLPDGFENPTNIDNSGSLVGDTIEWTVPVLASGAVAIFTYEATVTDTGNYINTASLADNFNDADITNNSAELTVDVYSLLEIVKEVSNISSDTTTWTVDFVLTVTNPGPSNITEDITVSDLLTSYGYTFSSVVSGTGYTSGTGNWVIAGGLNVGEQATITLRATTTTPSSTNTACISTAAYKTGNASLDCDSANNEVADLSIDKSTNPAISALSAGDTFAFIITITNAGPNVAQEVIIEDVIPDGYQIGTYTVSHGSYNPTTGIWDFGTDNLAVSGTATLTIPVTVIDPAPLSKFPEYTNTACIESLAQFDPTLTCDTVSPGGPDIQVVKEYSVKANGDKTFTITVSNLGAAATGLEITDFLPAGYTILSVPAGGSNPSVGVFSTSTKIWNGFDLAGGGSATLEFVIGLVDPSGLSTIDEDNYDPLADPPVTIDTAYYINEACLTALTEIDGNASNNCGQATAPKSNVALEITKDVNPTIQLPGGTVDFTITVTNTSADAAYHIFVKDILPSGYSFVSSDDATNFDETDGIWYIASLAATDGNSGGADEATITITATVLNVSNPNYYINEACIVDSYQNNSNGTTCDSATVDADVPVTDLAIYKYFWNDSGFVGDWYEFYIEIYNNGPDDATSVQVTDLIPAGLHVDYFGFYPGSLSVAPAESTGMVWDVGSFPAGSWGYIYVGGYLTQNSSDVIMNEACFTNLSEYDNDMSNNCASDTMTISTADLSVEKEIVPSNAFPGQIVDFYITVTNNGPNNASDIYIFDDRPSGYDFVYWDGDYSPGSGYWYIPSLLSGASVQLNIGAFVRFNGNYLNEACLDYSFPPDNNSANNCSSASIALAAQANAGADALQLDDVKSTLIPPTATATATASATPSITPLPPPGVPTEKPTKPAKVIPSETPTRPPGNEGEGEGDQD